jgi:hypothetical protein
MAERLERRCGPTGIGTGGQGLTTSGGTLLLSVRVLGSPATLLRRRATARPATQEGGSKTGRLPSASNHASVSAKCGRGQYLPAFSGRALAAADLEQNNLGSRSVSFCGGMEACLASDTIAFAYQVASHQRGALTFGPSDVAEMIVQNPPRDPAWETSRKEVEENCKESPKRRLNIPRTHSHSSRTRLGRRGPLSSSTAMQPAPASPAAILPAEGVP